MPICVLCSHLRRAVPGLTCDAFPKAIPKAIWANRRDHRQRVRGDHGIHFDPQFPGNAERAATILTHAGL